MKTQIHILCLFDYLCTTGFATVSQNIIPQLKRHFGPRLRLDIFAVNYFAQGVEPDRYTRIYPAGKLLEGSSNQDAFGRTAFLKILQETPYDGVFIIQDPHVILKIVPLLQKIRSEKKQQNRKAFKSMFYFPIDGRPLPVDFEHFDFFDKIVTYTEYGRKEVLSIRPELRSKLDVILHGVNPKNFYPLSPEKKKLFREDYFGKNASKTIVLSVNRNQPRKDIPTTIMAFEYYQTQYNHDAFLYLHMTPTDPMGWNLYTLLQQTNLKEGIDYMFPSEDQWNAGTSIETLNAIYNAADVFVTTTSGEGWGLTITEAMMCKCPVVAPDHSSITEIGGHGERIFELKELLPYCTHYDSMIRWQCHYEEVAEQLHEAITNRELAEKKVKLAYEYMQTITWDKICRRWIDLFQKTFF